MSPRGAFPRPARPTWRSGVRAVAATAVGAVGAVVLGTGIGIAHADVNPALGYDPVSDKGSLYNIAEAVGAHDAYRQGLTGKGVGVALIDSGVAPVAGLTSGNVVNGPDLSFDSQNPATAHVDGFGHGTHLASIIAGRDVAGTPSSYVDPNHFNGIAPDSTLVSVKVGASNGAVDVSQVIAGIDWVVEHAQDPGLNIRVINLSYGTDSTQSAGIDPLAYAVENAWRHGIVVVVSGGNDGTAYTLANPAYDPHVLAVGAMDDAGTVQSSDDTVPSWSTRGTLVRHVDVVAPGVSVLGLRVPGGTADTANPQARVGDRFARGSGTSQAAAVVSGEAALILQKYPYLTPDQVKRLVMNTASSILSTVPILGGSGLVNLRGILTNPISSLLGTLGGLLGQPLLPTWGSGTGSLEAARGSFHIGTDTAQLQGEIDIFGLPWYGSAWTRLTSSDTAWYFGLWRGERWAGDAWQGGTWPTAAWPITTAATGNDSWSTRMWADNGWSTRMWADDGWSTRMWADDGWF